MREVSEGERGGLERERMKQRRAFVDDGGFQCLTCVDLVSK